jgi:hypothetical protein
MMHYTGKWIYIRFNPNSYRQIDGKIVNPDMSVRLETLTREIKKQTKRIENSENTELLELVKLYYDGYN